MVVKYSKFNLLFLIINLVMTFEISSSYSNNE